MSYCFISDLHLSETEPTIRRLFLQFIAEIPPAVKAVYILGDFFDFWVGDDEQSALITDVKNALKTLRNKGIGCYFICGNRDFLLGKAFADEVGMVLLPDYHLIDLYDKKILLCHGDTLCIDDTAYQQFRRKVHQKWRQWLFLCLPLKLRLKIAHKIRAKSRQNKRQSNGQIMDVNAAFTAQIVQQFGAQWLIHGHTHRQAIHYEDGFTRIVLGDWGDTASILTLDAQGFQFNQERL